MQVQQRDTEISVLLGMLRTPGKGVVQASGQPAHGMPLDEQASMTAPLPAGHPADQAPTLHLAVSGMALIAYRCVCSSLWNCCIDQFHLPFGICSQSTAVLRWKLRLR